MEKEEKDIKKDTEEKKEDTKEKKTVEKTEEKHNSYESGNDSMVKKFLPIIIVITVIFILFIIFASLAKSCSGGKSSNEAVQKKMISAAKSYYEAHKDELPALSENKSISVNELVEAGYMKPLSKLLKDTSCDGKVNVYNNSDNYVYVPDLSCAEYKTTHIKDKILKDNLVETNVSETAPSDGKVSIGGDYISGLYDVNGTYIFKGQDPNNYFSFGGKANWRILGIESDGTIRLVKISQEKRNAYWDTKFNNDIGRYFGINDYKNSLILEKLNTSFENNIEAKDKVHLAPYSVCIARRPLDNLSKDRSIDCAEKLEKQYIGLPSVSDFANASLDENCTGIQDGACVNYNYLKDILVEAWTTTGVSDDTHHVYFINGGIATEDFAKNAYPYNWVIAINGDELYASGDGTIENPYTIEK